jgi:hypothetical protein
MMRKEEYYRRKAILDSKEKKKRAERWVVKAKEPLTLFTLLLVVSTIALVVVAVLQWRTLDKTDDTLKAQQRPWLSVGYPSAVNAFPVSAAGGAFVVDFKLKNFGNSPALNVEIDGEIPMMKSNLGLLGRQDAICRRLQDRPIGGKGGGLTIFPQEIIPKRVSFSIQRAAVERGIKSMGLPGSLFMPVIIGCVRYVYSADMSEHETGFVFNVMHLPPNGILSAANGDIPPQEILLISPEIGSSRAN